MENLKTGKCHHYWSIPFIKCLCQPSRHPAPPLFSFFERKNYVQNWHFVVDPWRFGKDKKKENCHILRRREEFLSWRLVMHTSGLFLGLAQHLKQTTKLSSSDYGQKIFAWYCVLGVCIEKIFTCISGIKQAPNYYHLNIKLCSKSYRFQRKIDR